MGFSQPPSHHSDRVGLFQNLGLWSNMFHITIFPLQSTNSSIVCCLKHSSGSEHIFLTALEFSAGPTWCCPKEFTLHELIIAAKLFPGDLLAYMPLPLKPQCLTVSYQGDLLACITLPQKPQCLTSSISRGSPSLYAASPEASVSN